MQSKKCTYFSNYEQKATLSELNPIRKPEKIENTSIFVETNLNAKQIVDVIIKLLQKYNIDIGRYRILFYKRDKNRCVYYNALGNCCTHFKSAGCYTFNTCSKYMEKTDSGVPSETSQTDKGDNLSNKNKIILDASLKVGNKKNVFLIESSVRKCPDCNEETDAKRCSIRFTKQGGQHYKILLFYKCPSCGKYYISKNIFETFSKNKDVSSMNYNFVEYKKKEKR